MGEHDAILEDNLLDPVIRGLARNKLFLRSYQCEPLREIYRGVQRREGERFTVTLPRQSGKNETQAQLESAVLSANLYRGGTIVKLLPTEKNQGQISRRRLEDTIRGSGQPKPRELRSVKDKTTLDSTMIRYLSASPNASIVGATADLMLEVDEAQLVSPEKFDREALPMAASTNAARIFWGTAWDDSTLLSRESRRAVSEQEKDGSRRRFITDAAAVGQEVPAYADFVREQISSFGREHPVVRTQLFCEEISDLTRLFTPERLELIRGTHRPLEMPEPDRCYVFMIDIAGSDELTQESRKKNGFSDRRDATVVTICDVYLPEGSYDDGAAPVWKVVARRYYRNLPAAELEAQVSREIDIWNPARVILDHTGLGCMLSDFLSRKYKWICQAYDITAQNKTKMAWDFLALINTGRWQEYHVDELEGMRISDFIPGRDSYEVLRDPALLQRMFFREMRACRMKPTANSNIVRWGVPDGTRDPDTGKFIHDDLVMSAALCVLSEGDLPIVTKLPPDLPWTDHPITGARRETYAERIARFR